MSTNEWIIAAAMLMLPLIMFGMFEGIAISQRRREKARAHRSKRRA